MLNYPIAHEQSVNGQSRLSLLQRGLTTADTMASKALSTHRTIQWPDQITEALGKHLERVSAIELRDGTVLTSRFDAATRIARAILRIHPEIKNPNLLYQVVLDPSVNRDKPAHGLGAPIDWPQVIQLLLDDEADDHTLDMAQSRLRWFLLYCFESQSVQSGSLRWADRPIWQFNTDRACRHFNSRYAGKPAGRINSQGRYQIGVFGKLRYRSTLVYAMTAGVWPNGEVDHRDGNHANDQPGNLRLATRAQNQANRRKYSGSQKFLNVSGNGSSYRALVQLDGKRLSRSFSSAVKAAVSADVMSCLSAGRFATTNLEEGYLKDFLKPRQEQAHARNIEIARALGVEREYRSMKLGVAMPPIEFMRELERASQVIGSTAGELRNIPGLFAADDLPEAFL